MKSKKQLSAVQLRLILAILMILIAAVGVGIFIYGYKMLTGVAKSSSEVAAQANQSDNSLQQLIQTQRDLAAQSNAVDRASKIVAESKSYGYQDQIISDLNAYASRSGVTITDISFIASKGTGSSAATSATNNPTTTATQVPTGSAQPANIKSTTAVVTLTSPIPYNNMLSFLYSIEQSLTKMRISNLSLSRSTDQNAPPGSVTCDALTVEVYLR